eukprot:2841071-Prymnesium_polylepis.4
MIEPVPRMLFARLLLSAEAEDESVPPLVPGVKKLLLRLWVSPSDASGSVFCTAVEKFNVRLFPTEEELSLDGTDRIVLLFRRERIGPFLCSESALIKKLLLLLLTWPTLPSAADCSTVASASGVPTLKKLLLQREMLRPLFRSDESSNGNASPVSASSGNTPAASPVRKKLLLRRLDVRWLCPSGVGPAAHSLMI